MRSIEYSCIVEANLAEVWEAWTTNEGVQTFFAPQSKVELKIGGDYELYFQPESKEGQRGSEGMKIQSYLPERMLAFDWNSPPQFGDYRGKKTWVVIEVVELDDDLCEVTLNHCGFGEGQVWDEIHDYFCKAWKLVLHRLERSFRIGAVDWENPPQL